MWIAGLIFSGVALYLIFGGPEAQAAIANFPGSLQVLDPFNNMFKVPAQTIVQVASAAGFQDPDLSTAVAIAMAESGGDPNAYNPETAAGTPAGKGSYGLWQIYLKAHPEFEGQDLSDPYTNAVAAYSIYRKAGNRFSPWSTFKSDAYLKYLDQAATAVNA